MRAVSLSLFLLGCSSAGPATASLDEAPSLVTLGEWSQTVGDQVPRVRVGFQFPDGRVTAIDREAIELVPRWRDGAALIDPERRLYQVWPDGNRRMLTRDAYALATDGGLLAYAVVPDLHGELRVHDGEHERTLARELASIGLLRVDGDRVLFVGAAPGGIAGVWVADDAGARCITNCDLSTGEPWQDRFEPPPTDPALLEAP